MSPTLDRLLACYRRQELRPAALQTLIEDLAELHDQTQSARIILETIDPGNPQAAEVRTQLLKIEVAWLELQQIIELRQSLARLQREQKQKGAA